MPSKRPQSTTLLSVRREEVPPVGCAARAVRPVYDDRFESDDPYEGHTPWLRRPAVRFLVTVIAVGSFLLATLVSSCGPRRVVPEPSPTTTIPSVQVSDQGPLPNRLVDEA